MARRLDAQQQRPCTPRLAHHAGGLRGASQDAREIRRMHPCQPQAVHRLGVGGDELGGEVGLRGVGGQQPGHLRDGGVVAVSEVFRCVGERRREGGVEGVDELPVGVAGELEAEVGLFGGGVGVHR